MDKKILGTFICVAFGVCLVACQQQPSTKSSVQIAQTSTPTFVAKDIFSTKTPSATKHNVFDLDGFEHFPMPSLESSITFSEEQLDLLKKKLDDVLGLDGSYSDLPVFGNIFRYENTGTSEIFLASYKYEWTTKSEIGFFLFNKANKIIYYSEPEIYSVYVHHRIGLVGLSETTQGIFYQIFTSTGGSGIYPTTYQKVYIWMDNQFETVWQWENSGGGQVGAFNQDWDAEYINFEKLTKSSMLDITLEKQRKIVSDLEYYRIYYPGKLVFSWTGEHYALTHFFDNEDLHPLRTNRPIVMAPGGVWGKIITEVDTAWFYSDRLRYTSTWDDNNIYLHISIHPENILQIAFDVDLEGDFESTVLSSDDFVFEIEVPKVAPDEACENTVTINPLSTSAMNTDITVSSSGDFIDCSILVAIPRTDMFLDHNLVEASSHTYSYKDKYGTIIQERYHTAGEIIGFAIQPKQFSDIYKFDMSNPVTWGTLIFTSKE
ncbi:MAG: hypothetical protein GY755_17120 [Chloroflexi bacterium]|nr:hypothetical protein [Chloroflexota bacterium]